MYLKLKKMNLVFKPEITIFSITNKTDNQTVFHQSFLFVFL